MKLVRHTSLSLLFSSALIFAAPAPNSVQNPGSNSLPGLPNYGIAQGSVFVVYGSGLGPSTLAVAPSLPLQTTLSGTSVTVTVGSTTVNALMSYTSAGQIACVLPSNTPVGTGTLTVTYGGASGSTPIVVAASNFGILTANETGTGPAVATHGDYSLITGTAAANPGEEIVVWGTGLGPLPGGVSDADAPGAVGNLSAAVTVYVGGQQASVAYHGRNASDPGLDQINVFVPPGVTGCYVSLVVQTGGVVSNTTSIAVASSGSVCSDANGLSFSSLSGALGSKSSASIGFIGLIQDQFGLSFGGISQTINSSVGTATFQKYTALQLTESSSVFSLPSIGSCSILITNSTSSAPTSIITATGLDAGASLAVTGPAGNVTMKSDSTIGKGYYSGTFSSVPPGTYQINGTGGADVGAFTATLKAPPTLTWTNQSAVTGSPISRTSPLTLNWTGGDSTSYVVIEGISANPNPNKASSTLGAVFVCIAPIAPGTFTIPTSVLQSLPASATSAGSLGVLLFGSASAPQSFTAPGLDVGFALTESIGGTTVTWQ